MTELSNELRLDHPLKFGNARKADVLNRLQFATSVSSVLKRVSKDAGLVVAVEGAWGCGKTSLLAILEELLNDELPEQKPIVVHFNPWLIGDRDALLRQFLASIAKEVKLADHAKAGKRVAKELKTYSKAFDVLKLIPGAEPWASMVKSVVESMGDATDSVFDYKTPDIEARKQALEKALQNFPRRIVVMVDDIDRLFPSEAFEMVRIVKAVGDLPNIGYVLAWDPSYVGAALENLDVPFAATYLDKVVQVRLPIPPLSFQMRVELMNQGLNRLPQDAHKKYFANGDERLALMFHEGLAELMEQPRDVVRLFDVAQSIEVGLRGEVHLADIIALACLMTKAPKVYELLCRVPQAFVGRRPGNQNAYEDTKDVLERYAAVLTSTIDSCAAPNAIRTLVHWLFPQVAQSNDVVGFARTVFTEGHLAHPERLLVALHQSALPSGVQLAQVRQFLLQPETRTEIGASLDQSTCKEFVEHIGDMAEGMADDFSFDAEELVIAVSRIVDTAPFIQRAKQRQSVWDLRASRTALGAIEQVAKNIEPGKVHDLVERIITDPFGLSVAAELVSRIFLAEEKSENRFLKLPDEKKKAVILLFAQNIVEAARTGAIFDKVSLDIILWVASRSAPEHCGAIFRSFLRHRDGLDKFAEAFLRNGFDSRKGQVYGFPEDMESLSSFVSLEEFQNYAKQRLEDDAITYPVKAAWRAITEGRKIYGADGTFYET